ncbi:uncharacterized protein [Euwallacea fornicatus]|uniref:uncharacterized protein n=1 Tax=Euwallacea fornicatus TaxID=995702 RepID=UPI00338FEDC5
MVPCETQLLNSLQASANCQQIDVTITRAIANRIDSSDRWVLIIPTEKTIKLKCNGQEEYKRISESFLLTVPEECRAEGEDIVINNDRSTTTTNEPITFPRLDDQPPNLPHLDLNFHLQEVKLDELYRLKSEIQEDNPELFITVMEDSMAKLVRKRASAKARITTFGNYVKSLEKAKAKNELTELDLAELEQRIHRIEEALSDFNIAQSSIEELANGEDLENVFKERDAVEFRFYQASAAAHCLIDRCVKKPLNEGAPSIHSTEHSSDREAKGKVKVPSLQLPKFDGSYDKWAMFHDHFEKVIHLNDPSRRSKRLDISAKNYEEAWDLLKRQYEDKPFMIHKHVDGILDSPKIVKCNHPALNSLYRNVSGHLRALKALGQPVETWNSLLIEIVLRKLESLTKAEWEKERVDSNDPPENDDLLDFLQKQCKLLARKAADSEKPAQVNAHGLSSGKPSSKRTTFSHAATQGSVCPLCNEHHLLYVCPALLQMPVQARINKMKELHRCLNCFRPGHSSYECKSSYKCKRCKKSHNTLLHLSKIASAERDNPISEAPVQTALPVSVNLCRTDSSVTRILPTAVVQVQSPSGAFQDCVTLLDSDSQSNFLSKVACEKLQLPVIPTNIRVIGIYQCKSNVSEITQACIQSKHTSFKSSLTFFVSERITSNIPAEPKDLKGFDLPKNIRLADPNFHKPKPIDMIIGVDLFWDLFCKESQKYPYLHNTKLGDVISGRFPSINPVGNSTLCNLATISNPRDTNLNLVLKIFFEIEECPQFLALSSEERACEKIFSETIRKDENGRFIVIIPFKGSLDSLGESFEQAERRFFAMERKFARNPALKDIYVKFMQDYLNFGHMTKVVDEVQPPKHVYYLPHHGVLKKDSLTTKLRVVFDGSAVTSTGISINDIHMTGPTIQPELFSAMLRFRIYPYVVGADVSMMYRQILVEPQQRSLQRILWRANPTQPVERLYIQTQDRNLKKSLNSLNKNIKTMIYQYRHDKWLEACEDIERDRELYSDEEKADAFARYFQQSFRTTHNIKFDENNWITVNNWYDNYFDNSTNHKHIYVPITDKEYEDTLQQLKNTAPGKDNIQNKILQNLTPNTQTQILGKLNECLKNRAIPYTG